MAKNILLQFVPSETLPCLDYLYSAANEYQQCWEGTWTSVRSMRVSATTLYLLALNETRFKHRPSLGAMAYLSHNIWRMNLPYFTCSFIYARGLTYGRRTDRRTPAHNHPPSHTHTRTHAHTDTRTHAHTHIRTHARAYANTCTHTHTTTTPPHTHVPFHGNTSASLLWLKFPLQTCVRIRSYH